MLLDNKEIMYILGLMLADKDNTEKLIPVSSEQVRYVLNSNLEMIKRLILEFKLATTVNFQAEAAAISSRYIFIKNYNELEMYWTEDSLGYTQDIGNAGTFSENEAKHYYKGHVFRLIDLINGKHKNVDGYAVTIGDYISYLQALIK